MSQFTAVYFHSAESNRSEEGKRTISLKQNNKSNRNNEVYWETEPGALDVRLPQRSNSTSAAVVMQVLFLKKKIPHLNPTQPRAQIWAPQHF